MQVHKTKTAINIKIYLRTFEESYLDEYLLDVVPQVLAVQGPAALLAAGAPGRGIRGPADSVDVRLGGGQQLVQKPLGGGQNLLRDVIYQILSELLELVPLQPGQRLTDGGPELDPV